MSRDINHLKNALNKADMLGVVDTWLNAIGFAVQAAMEIHEDKTSAPRIDGIDVTELIENTHVLAYNPKTRLPQTEIEKLHGYSTLLEICKTKNVCLILADTGTGSLIADFTPGDAFSNSEIFGKSFANVVPGNFGHKHKH